MIRMGERIREVETTEEKRWLERIKNMEIWEGKEEGVREKGKRDERDRGRAGGTEWEKKG